jgi:hypothetical protein
MTNQSDRLRAPFKCEFAPNPNPSLARWHIRDANSVTVAYIYPHDEDYAKFVAESLNGYQAKCTLETCGHMKQLSDIVTLLGMPLGTRSVLDELRSRMTCDHAGLKITFSSGDLQKAGRVQWCTGCGSVRYERDVTGAWTWCEWIRAANVAAVRT